MIADDDKVRNPYALSKVQRDLLDTAEDAFEMSDYNKAESIYNQLMIELPNCIPVLNNMAHLYDQKL